MLLIVCMFSSCAIFSFFVSSRRRHTSFALVTGVQTCALPIWLTQARFSSLVQQALKALPEMPEWIEPSLLERMKWSAWREALIEAHRGNDPLARDRQIGRASCRERVCQYV